MRAVTRITGVSINTVTKLLEDAVNLPCTTIQCDEIWAFCGKKAKERSRCRAGRSWHRRRVDLDSNLRRNQVDGFLHGQVLPLDAAG